MRNGADIDAPRRFVQDDDRRLLHQRFRQHDLLLVAAGKLDDARLALQRVDLQSFDPVIGELAAAGAREEETPAAAGGKIADIDVVVDDHRLEEAVGLAILGDVGDAVVDRLSRHAVADRLAAQPDGAAVDEIALERAIDDLGDFGPARPDQAGDAHHLAGIDRERHVLDDHAHGDVFDREHLLAAVTGVLPAAIDRLRHLAADHVLDQRVARQQLRWSRDDQPAVAQHRNAVGDLQRFLQRM